MRPLRGRSSRLSAMTFPAPLSRSFHLKEFLRFATVKCWRNANFWLAFPIFCQETEVLQNNAKKGGNEKEIENVKALKKFLAWKDLGPLSFRPFF